MTETVNVERDIAIAQALDEIGVLGSSDQTDVDEFIAELEQRGYRIEATRQAEADKAELVGALRQLHHVMCSDTGFMAAVREHTGTAFPWEPWEQIKPNVETLLAKHGGRDE